MNNFILALIPLFVISLYRTGKGLIEAIKEGDKERLWTPILLFSLSVITTILMVFLSWKK